MAKGTLQIEYEKLVLDNLDLKERNKELGRRLLEHLKGHSLEAVCDDCSSHYWYVDDEPIVCPHCCPNKALEGK